jgi:hypothetical protein
MIAIMTQANFEAAKPSLPSQTILGTPLIAIDGRIATCHPFTAEDIAYLKSFGATMCDSLPGDFVLPKAEP